MPSTTVSSLLLFGFGTNCRLLLCPLPSRHSGLDYRHFGDSDVNLDTFILFYVHFLARFYRPEICRLLPQRFMHICHARHYSTLKKVHYWKRDTQSSQLQSLCSTYSEEPSTIGLIMLQKRQTTGENGVTICMMHTCVIRTKNYKPQLRRCNLQNILKTNIGCGLSRDT